MCSNFRQQILHSTGTDENSSKGEYTKREREGENASVEGQHPCIYSPIARSFAKKKKIIFLVAER